MKEIKQIRLSYKDFEQYYSGAIYPPSHPSIGDIFNDLKEAPTSGHETIGREGECPMLRLAKKRTVMVARSSADSISIYVLFYCPNTNSEKVTIPVKFHISLQEEQNNLQKAFSIIDAFSAEKNITFKFLRPGLRTTGLQAGKSCVVFCDTGFLGLEPTKVTKSDNNEQGRRHLKEKEESKGNAVEIRKDIIEKWFNLFMELENKLYTGQIKAGVPVCSNKQEHKKEFKFGTYGFLFYRYEWMDGQRDHTVEVYEKENPFNGKMVPERANVQTLHFE
jgi:hypothetical protein